MKMKKIVASLAAAAMAVSSMAAMSVSAVTAGATSLDFEDGDCSFVYMNVDDAGADNSVLSVEDYNGSKRLKVDVQDKKKGPKVWFDLDKIMDRANTVQIRKITFDLTIVPKTTEGIVGWVGGAVGAAGGFNLEAAGKGQVDPSWNQGTWDGGAYDPGVAAEVKVERKFMMKNEFYTETGTNPFFGLMKWAAADDVDDYVMYVDNVQFFDSKGKNITVGVTPAEETTAAPEETTAAAEETTAASEETTAAPEETTAAPADEEVADVEDDEAPAPETEAAPAETEAAPAETAAATVTEAAVTTAAVADTNTTPAATGNVAVASIAAVMAIAGGAVIASRKRK